MPETFLRAALTASILRVAGVIVLAGSTFWPILWHVPHP
jgi:hypothetical protein